MLNNKPSAFSVFKTFLKLGLTSFGGPIAHIGYFRKELVEKQHWVNEHQFSQLLAICQFLPGPASSQLGFALGLLRAGWQGALAAFAAFTLPSALLLISFAALLPLLSSAVGIATIHGLKLVAVCVIADAVFGMAKKLCPDMRRRIIAITAAAILHWMDSSWAQMLVIIAGAIAGILFCHQPTNLTQQAIQCGYTKQQGIRLFLIFLALLLMAILIPNQSVFTAIAQAFYQAGALVFGGGHVVLPLLEEAVVNTGWVNHEDFLAGYGASQAIPGPMFSFAAYLGAITPSHEQISWLGASIALASIFLPGFLLITAALPMWESIAKNPKAAQAIAGINAVVVGILAATLYNPVFTSSVLSTTDLLVSAVGICMLIIGRLSPLYVVFWCIIASLVSSYLTS
ncbi:MAG: chromate efflux transporter [Methylophilaceae bacterium]